MENNNKSKGTDAIAPEKLKIQKKKIICVHGHAIYIHIYCNAIEEEAVVVVKT